MTVCDQLPGLRLQLAAAADPARAESMAAYMQHRFDFLGVTTPDRRKVLKASITTSVVPDRADLIDAVEQLWASTEREFHYCGVDLLRRWHRVLSADDLTWLGSLVTTHSWWDTVDALATHPVGRVVERHRAVARSTLDQWAASDDLWLNRTAILHQLLYKDQTDAEQLFAYCDTHATSSEFFHRKAIGWALRQYARTDPDAVIAYVDASRNTLSSLTVREALKHLSTGAGG